MNPSRPAREGRAARRPSVTRGPDSLWFSSATAAEGGDISTAPAPTGEGGHS